MVLCSWGCCFLSTFVVMNLKQPLTYFGLLITILFVSCSGNSTKTDTKTIDTVAIKTPEELKKLNLLIAAEPNNANLYHKRAQYYFDKKDFNASLADMNKVMSIDSSKAEYFLTISDIYFVNNLTSKSKTALEKCIQLDDKNTIAMLKLAELYLYVRKYKESVQYINMALKLDKYNAKAYFMKGMNYKELKDTAKAISSMQTAVEQDQQYYNAYIQLGILCAAQGNSLAVQYYKNAIKLKPRSTEAWYDLGKCYQDMESWANAISSYNALLKIDVSYKYAHYNLGVVYFLGLKKYPEAIDHYTQAINLDPKYTEAYYARGICFKEMHKMKDAIKDFVACTSINPDFEPAKEVLKEMNHGVETH